MVASVVVVTKLTVVLPLVVGPEFTGSKEEGAVVSVTAHEHEHENTRTVASNNAMVVFPLVLNDLFISVLTGCQH